MSVAYHSDSDALVKAIDAMNSGEKEIAIRFNKLGDAGANTLADTLANNKSLLTLILYRNKIGNWGATALASALRNHAAMHTLDFGDNEIGSEGVTALAGALVRKESLFSLSLAGNKIGSEGAVALAKALLKNSSLHTLNLAGNIIGAKGAKALAQALAKNDSLQTLNLARNDIGDEGATALASALTKNRSLQTLFLSCNKISSEGATALATALAKNRTLRVLYLGTNEIGSAGASALADALATNESLHTLNLFNSTPAIQAALQRNEALYLKSQSPLMQACRKGNILTAKTLVTGGAQIDELDSIGKTPLVHACEANDAKKSIVLAKMLFGHSAGLSSESLKVREAQACASSKMYMDLSVFLLLVQSLPLAQLHTNELRTGVVTLFDKGVQTVKEARSLTPARFAQLGMANAQASCKLLRAMADAEQFVRLEDLAAKVSLARAKRSESELVLHPALLNVFEDHLSRDDPIAELALSDAEQEIIREDVETLNELQERVVLEPQFTYRRNHVRRDLVGSIRDTLSSGIKKMFERLSKDQDSNAVVESCRKLWKDIFDESANVDDADNAATFEEMQQATRDAVHALKAWESRHDSSGARERTIAAIDALERRTQRMGIRPTFFMTLRFPERTHELSMEVHEVQEALQAELGALTEVAPMSDAPLHEVRRALALTISFYTRTMPSEISRLQIAVEHLTALLSHHAPGLSEPNTMRVKAIMREIRSKSRQRADLERDLQYAREDASDGDADAQAKIPDLERELAHLGSVFRLDSELRRERARALRHAEEYFPEFLQDQKWLAAIGVTDSALQDLSRLGLWLTNAKCEDFETLAELASKPGKSVPRVRDPEGREFVLKSFHLANEVWSSRFCRQVTALAQIQSAYIVRIQGAFMQDARQGCILIPYYSGADLADWLRKNPHADMATRRRIAIGLLSGLHDLHSKGFVHCDIKPENIFLAPGLSPVLGDFDGVQMHDVTMSQPMHATIKYMAPELRSGTTSKVGPEVDLYSMGVVLAELFKDLQTSEAMKSLLSSLQSSDPTQRLSALLALRHEAFQVEPVPVNSCAICLDIFPVELGVSCPNGHFTCKDCLSASVRVATQPRAHIKVSRDGSMCCVTPDCERLVSGRNIAAMVPDEDFAALLSIVREHFERDIAAEQERQVQHRVDAELREHGLDRTTQEHLRAIRNEVLNLSCPRCSTVFAEFDGCCALKCSACPCYFCAWCLQDTGDSSDACHRAVAGCKKKPDGETDPFFSDIAVVREAWARLRRQRLHHYMKNRVHDPKLSAKIQEMLRPDLTPDIIGDDFKF